jgi:hypothetical protein
VEPPAAAPLPGPPPAVPTTERPRPTATLACGPPPPLSAWAKRMPWHAPIVPIQK